METTSIGGAAQQRSEHSIIPRSEGALTMDSLLPQDGFERSLTKIRVADSIRAENAKDGHAAELKALNDRISDAVEYALAALGSFAEHPLDRKQARAQMFDLVNDLAFDEMQAIKSRISECDEEIARADAP